MVTNLRLDWCSHEAAKYAVEHWHYSKSLPAAKSAKCGVWEDGKFIGAIIFAWGANKNLAGSFDLSQVQCAELCRVALDKHKTPVSRIVAHALRMLKKQSSGLRLVVSFADPRQNHIGTIYQAGGWVYAGLAKSTPDHLVNGRWMHQRQVNSLYGTIRFPHLRRAGIDKHRYLMPLDDEMRERIEPLRKPYPKRALAERETGAASSRDTGGANPTNALMKTKRKAKKGAPSKPRRVTETEKRNGKQKRA